MKKVERKLPLRYYKITILRYYKITIVKKKN